MDHDIECLGVSPEILPQDGRVTIQGQGLIFCTTEIFFVAKRGRGNSQKDGFRDWGEMDILPK